MVRGDEPHTHSHTHTCTSNWWVHYTQYKLSSVVRRGVPYGSASHFPRMRQMTPLPLPSPWSWHLALGSSPASVTAVTTCCCCTAALLRRYSQDQHIGPLPDRCEDVTKDWRDFAQCLSPSPLLLMTSPILLPHTSSRRRFWRSSTHPTNRFVLAFFSTFPIFSRQVSRNISLFFRHSSFVLDR